MSRPKPNITEQQTKERKALWVRRWREKYPERQALARKKAYNNRKFKAFQKISINVSCVRCGCDCIDFLEFNHIGGGGCIESRQRKRVAMVDMILTKKRNLKGLEILCRVCNALDFLERKNKEEAKNYQIIYNKKI